MKIGIIGLGIVGSAVDYGLRMLGHEIYPHDIKLKTTVNDVLDTEICYVCVPTPESDSGQCDVSIVKTVVKELVDNKYEGIIAIKSTVVPGTTSELQQLYPSSRFCFVPEFLRERCAIADFVENHDLCIIGTNDESIFETIKKSHGKYPKHFEMLDIKEAELCKYFNNVYNATLITFANSFYEICKGLGVDYTTVKNAISKREKIADVYLECNENMRGFGGVCLPKDTAALDSLAKELNLDVDFFRMKISENKKYKTTVFKGMRL